jgi:quercetin dioxygenase-like cupin family protein
MEQGRAIVIDELASLQLEANGRVVGPGAYVHFPAGEAMRHQAAGDEACLFVILFHGPCDVQVVDD